MSFRYIKSDREDPSFAIACSMKRSKKKMGRDEMPTQGLRDHFSRYDDQDYDDRGHGHPDFDDVIDRILRRRYAPSGSIVKRSPSSDSLVERLLAFDQGGEVDAFPPERHGLIGGLVNKIFPGGGEVYEGDELPADEYPAERHGLIGGLVNKIFAEGGMSDEGDELPLDEYPAERHLGGGLMKKIPIVGKLFAGGGEVYEDEMYEDDEYPPERHQLGVAAAGLGKMAAKAAPAAIQGAAEAAGSAAGAQIGSSVANQFMPQRKAKGGRIDELPPERHVFAALAGMAAKALPALVSKAVPAAVQGAASSAGASIGSSLANQFMPQRQSRGGEMMGYSEGGRVANRTPAIAGRRPNEFDYLVLNDYLESSYGDDDNSGDDLGYDHVLEMDQKAVELREMVDRVMKRRARKYGLRGVRD